MNATKTVDVSPALLETRVIVPVDVKVAVPYDCAPTTAPAVAEVVTVAIVVPVVASVTDAEVVPDVVIFTSVTVPANPLVEPNTFTGVAPERVLATLKYPVFPVATKLVLVNVQEAVVPVLLYSNPVVPSRNMHATAYPAAPEGMLAVVADTNIAFPSLLVRNTFTLPVFASKFVPTPIGIVLTRYVNYVPNAPTAPE